MNGSIPDTATWGPEAPERPHALESEQRNGREAALIYEYERALIFTSPRANICWQTRGSTASLVLPDALHHAVESQGPLNSMPFPSSETPSSPDRSPPSTDRLGRPLPLPETSHAYQPTHRPSDSHTHRPHPNRQ